MRSELSGRNIMSTIMGFIDKFTESSQSFSSEGQLDTFQREISQLERQLAKIDTRPLADARRSPQFTEPVTEQQKIMDMSG